MNAYQVIIIGAGISGLTAGRKLAQDGIKVLIVEGRDRLGGRIHTWDMAKKQTWKEEADVAATSMAAKKSRSIPMDLGASFIHGIEGNPVKELQKEIGFETFTPAMEESLMLVDRSNGESWPSEKAEKVGFFSRAVLFQRLAECAEHVRQGSQGRRPGVEESLWSALSGDADAYARLWEHVEPEKLKVEVMNVLKTWTGWTGAQHSDVSLRWWGTEEEYEGADELVLPGYQVLIDWSAEKVKQLGGTILLNTTIAKVTRRDQSVLVTTQDSHNFTAPYVISSLPLGVMQQRPPSFDPPLPNTTLNAIQAIGMGLLNKIVIAYERAWWREDAKIASPYFCLLPSFMPTSEQGYKLPQEELPTSAEQAEWLVEHQGIFVQNFDHINGLPVLLMFIGPPLGNAVEMLKEEWVVQTIHDRLVNTLVTTDAQPTIPKPRVAHVTRWNSDPFSCGSYSYIPAAATSPQFQRGGSKDDMVAAGRAIWHDRLGFCGEHTEPNKFASVHGALLSGEREAERILHCIRTQNATTR